MLKPHRRDSSAASSSASWAKVTARVRRLVDDVHDGNLLEASAHAGLPYAILRDFHSGRVRRPGIGALERLAEAYGLPVDWFLDGSAADDGTVPLAGWAGFLPESADGFESARRITIPYGAWPLIRVLVQLEQSLSRAPAAPDRPIIGAATDPREIRRRLLAFLFQPLRAAESVAGEPRRPMAAGPSVAALRELGRFWEHALRSLVPGLASGAVGEVA